RSLDLAARAEPGAPPFAPRADGNHRQSRCRDHRSGRSREAPAPASHARGRAAPGPGASDAGTDRAPHRGHQRDLPRRGAHTAHGRPLPRSRSKSVLHAQKPRRLPHPDPRLHRGLRHAGGELLSPGRALPLDPRPHSPRRALADARVLSLLRVRPEPAAVPDERHLDRRRLQPPRPAAPPSPGAEAAQESHRHVRRVLLPLLHLPGWHGPLLDVDQLRPARPPGDRTAMAPPQDRGSRIRELIRHEVRYRRNPPPKRPPPHPPPPKPPRSHPAPPPPRTRAGPARRPPPPTPRRNDRPRRTLRPSSESPRTIRRSVDPPPSGRTARR